MRVGDQRWRSWSCSRRPEWPCLSRLLETSAIQNPNWPEVRRVSRHQVQPPDREIYYGIPVAVPSIPLPVALRGLRFPGIDLALPPVCKMLARAASLTSLL